MKHEINLQPLLSQKLKMTQELRKSIELLALNNIELARKLEQEVMENPMLEMEENWSSTDFLDKNTPWDKDKEKMRRDRRDLAWENSFNNSQNYGLKGQGTLENSNRSQSQGDADAFQSFIEGTVYQEESLQEKILQEVNINFDPGMNLEIAKLIVSALDERGFLTQDIFELASSMGYNDKGEIEYVLKKIQRLEPVGLATKNVMESLRVQAQVIFPKEKILHQIIKEEFKNLKRLDIEELAKKFEVTSFEILRNLKLLSSLKPYPASQIDSSDIRYITPDIFVYNEGDNILIVINDHWLPKIQINNEYRSLIQKKGAKASSVLKKEDMDYLGGKMNSANWLLQGIEQRRKTIYRVMEAITFYQRDFFLSGPDHLKPLSLQDVAQKLELNKSTISRITSGKYVETPFGLFELKHFFHRKMDLDHGESAIAGDIQRKIKEIIENEETPLSDQEIVTELKKWGIQIARRTVAKYREEMRILPSNLRGKNKQKII